MPGSKKADLRSLTLSDALNLMTVDQLKSLVALLPTTEKPTRKLELVALVERHLDGERLRALWEQLDDLQQKAVSETIYSAAGVFEARRFAAKYGQLPHLGTKDTHWGYREVPSRLRLFLYSGMRYSQHLLQVPADLQQRLRRFVPQPAAPALKASALLPEFFELSQAEYAYPDNDDEGIILVAGRSAYRLSRQPPTVKTTVTRIPLTRRDTERAALQDVQTMLRLIDRGRVAVSDKTLHASGATMAEIAALLRDGDFYELHPKKPKWEQEIGPVKAFAWPLLVQAAGLVELHGHKLALTKAGRQALGAPGAETLRRIWQRWLKTKLFDEFRRIEVIKGQSGRGRNSMTAVDGRRLVIAEALQHCPVGQWVQVDDFFRFMQAASFDFAVTREPWDLYIVDAQYGSLGYEGHHDWPILQGRYTLCLLFEYAATLGLIDVAYVEPAGVRNDFTHLWGVDDVAFLSRYDGLRYFRLNALGAYCLGLTKTYEPGHITVSTALTVLPSLQINVTAGSLSPDEALLLETYAEQVADNVWRLSRDKALAAIESGHQIAELHEFLQRRDNQPLPETVEGFIVTSERQARALHIQGPALLIACVDAETAATVATHELTRQWCQRAGERHVVISADAEEPFRKALRALGYGMPRL
jgi:hypothetical protein